MKPPSSPTISQIDELTRQLEFQERLRETLGNSIVDGVKALLSIQIRELEAKKLQEDPPVPSNGRTGPAPQSPRPAAGLVLAKEAERAFVQLLMSVVTVDGLTKNSELLVLRNFFPDRLGYSPEATQRIDSYVQEAQDKDELDDIDGLLMEFERFPDADRLSIYSVCLEIAFADDELADEERQLLADIARRFKIDDTQARTLEAMYHDLSVQKQEALKMKVRGQYPIDSTISFVAPAAPRAEAQKALPVEAAVEQAVISESAEVKAETISFVPPDVPRVAPQTGSPTDLVALLESPEVKVRTIELMAFHLAEGGAAVTRFDSKWKKVTDLAPGFSDFETVLESSEFFCHSSPTAFRLNRPLSQWETFEARVFSMLLDAQKPISGRLIARTSKGDPNRVVQLVIKVAKESPALVHYSYGCGTWVGLAIWGYKGYEEAARQNWILIRKQMSEAGRNQLTRPFSGQELEVIQQVALSMKDRTMMELAS